MPLHFRRTIGGFPQPAADIWFPLAASADKRSLVTNAGVPFFLMGDGSAQGLCQQTISDVTTYLNARAAQGFNAIWMHVVTNALVGSALTANGATQDGIVPFLGTLDGTTVDGGPNYDLTTPNPAYFQRQDQILRMAASCGMTVFWDMWDNDSYPNVYPNNGDTRVSAFAAYLRQRYQSLQNIVWMVGNDFQDWNSSPTDNQIGKDLLVGVSGDLTKLRTVELNYNMSGSSDNTLLSPYVTASSAYTYYPTYYQTLKEYNQGTVKPVYLVESYYEGANYGGLTPNIATNAMLRRIAWWSTCAGALAGYFYGHNTVYDFASGWQSALSTTAVTQLGYWKAFFASLTNWSQLVPDQSHAVVTAGYGTATGNISGQIDTDTYVTAARTPDGKLILAYNPAGNTLTVDMTQASGTITARWFDPSSGAYTAIGSFANTGTHNFSTPGNNAAGDPDWVLVGTA